MTPEQVVDELESRGRTAILISFIMPKTGRITANALSRADIQSLRTENLADETIFYRVLKAIGEIGEAGLTGSPNLQSNSELPYEFKGDRLEMTLSEFKTRHRREANGVVAPFCSSQGSTSEPWHRDAKIVHCTIESPLEASQTTVGGVPTKLLMYEFVDERLCRISIAFSNDGYHAVERSMQQKYGEPHISKGKDTSVWGNGVSSIHLFRGKGKEDSGLVFLHEDLFEVVKGRSQTLRDIDL